MIRTYDVWANRGFLTWFCNPGEEFGATHGWFGSGICGDGVGTASPGAWPPVEWYDWYNLLDPCDEVEDKANLYVEQAWSVEGIIDEGGATVSDSMNAPKILGQPLSIGPWEPKNVMTGGVNRIQFPPLSVKHHVGFAVSGVTTEEGKIAGLARSSINVPLVFIPPSGVERYGPVVVDSNSPGSIEFYFIITNEEDGG